jgi:biopolymer transport protein TolQ
MNNVISTTENLSYLSNNVAPSGTSMFSLIANADLVVQVVMLILLLASIWSWSVIFNKFMILRDLNEKSEKFEKLFWSGQLLSQLYERIKGRTDHPLANIFVAAMGEWGREQQSSNYALTLSLKDRIYKAMSLVVSRESNKLEANLSFLAMVGSSATFIGLFGTVWGIIHSFQDIATAKNTSLAVVAPGIAEALLATAIGLFAAIPATSFYNILSQKINNFQASLEDFATELGSLLSRELDDEQK